MELCDDDEKREKENPRLRSKKGGGWLPSSFAVTSVSQMSSLTLVGIIVH